MLHCSPLMDSPHSEESTCPSVGQEHQQEQREQCEPGAPLGRGETESQQQEVPRVRIAGQCWARGRKRWSP